MSLAAAHAILDRWRDDPPRGDDDLRDILEDVVSNGFAGFWRLTPPGFQREPDWEPRRPERIRRIMFADEWVRREIHLSDMVVPLECVRAGDRQVLVADRGADYRTPTITDLDCLAGFPDVESVIGGAVVRLRTPLPHVRELSASPLDDETLRNLPSLRMLHARRRRPDDAPPLHAAAAAEGLEDLMGNPFEDTQALLRFRGLRRLMLGSLYDESAEPLAELGELRWLDADPGRGIRHLAKLEHLELLDLDIQEGPRLANLKRLSPLTRLRVLRVNGRGLRSLDGIEAMRALEALWLYRPGISDLAPLRGLDGLTRVRFDGPDYVDDFEPVAELPALRRLEVELHKSPRTSRLPWARALQERRPDVEVVWAEPWEEPGGTRVGEITYRQLDDGTWSIFQDVTDLLGVQTNHGAEDRVRAHVAREHPDLLPRLEFDSEGDAFCVSAADEADIRRAAEIVNSLASAP